MSLIGVIWVRLRTMCGKNAAGLTRRGENSCGTGAFEDARLGLRELTENG